MQEGDKMEEIRKCIKEVSKIIHSVAGVVDYDGTIFACTDESFEGSEDPSSRAVFLSDDKISITSGKTYCRLSVGEKTNYACFIEGTDTVSRTYLEFIVNWILAVLKERNTDAERESFLKKVLLENELPGDIPLKAREFKIPYAATRVAFIVRVDQVDGIECVEVMHELFPNFKKDHVLAMDEETIVLLSEIGRDESSRINETAMTILDNLNAESMTKVHIGIGMYADTLRDAAKSYREASLALTVGNIFESDSYVMRYDRLGLGRLIYQLPTTLCNMFLDEVFPKGSYESLDNETLLTISKFFENNLNGSETSRQLFVHRNTLVYRLDKVQKITGLDLRNFDDAVLFKLASMVRRYLEKQEKGIYKSSSGKWWNS
jgi:carbohydrate diacid regulator